MRTGAMIMTGSIFLLLTAGCILEPTSEIQVEYTINSVTWDSVNYNIEVNYSIYNSGDYDLDNLRVYIELDTDNDDVFDAAKWSTEFSLNSGQNRSRTLYYYDPSVTGSDITGALPSSKLARITKVGMDNPEN